MPNTDFVALPNCPPCPVCDRVHKHYPIYCIGKAHAFHLKNCRYNRRDGWKHVKDCKSEAMLELKLIGYANIRTRK